MKEEEKIKVLDNIKVSLAKYAHDSWSGWMRYLFDNSRKNNGGSVTIPKDFVSRWERQMNTDFFDLPKDEQKSDYQEADKILSLIRLILSNM